MEAITVAFFSVLTVVLLYEFGKERDDQRKLDRSDDKPKEMTALRRKP